MKFKLNSAADTNGIYLPSDSAVRTYHSIKHNATITTSPFSSNIPWAHRTSFTASLTDLNSDFNGPVIMAGYPGTLYWHWCD